MWNSKPKKSGHGCGKKKFGQPKRGRGICHNPFQYRAAVEERIKNGRLVRGILFAVQFGIDPDDIDD